MLKENKDKSVIRFFCVTIAVLFLLCLFLPKDKFSESERRPLASFPKFTVERLLNGKFMSEFEKYTLDAFPFRDGFRTIKAVTSNQVFMKMDNNGIYAHDGYLSKVEYPPKPQSIDKAASRFQYVVDKYLPEGNKAYLSIIPDKNYFLAEQSGHLSIDYDKFVEDMKTSADFLTYIDIFDVLEKDDYYLTDTHWKQEEIVPVADKLAEGMGITLRAEYEKVEMPGPFYGVYKGQSALPFRADKLSYLTNETLENAYVFDYQNNRETKVYDLKKAEGKDPYELFLGGPISLITMENKGSETGRNLVLFRDSFGSSLAPLLLEGYDKITVVDIRYLSPDMLGKFIDFSNSDFLFLYSTMVLNNAETLK